MPNIFEQNNYRDILRSTLWDKKAQYGRDITYEKMAKACRLQRTYLSAVLAGNGHLNADQVYMACKFLGFDDDEYLYTSLHHELERSVVPSRKKRLKQDIQTIRSRRLATEQHIESSIPPTSDGLNEFYLDFNAQLIHMFLTVKRYKHNLQKIQETLGINAVVFQSAIKKLESAGLVSAASGYVEVINDNLHLPSTSSFYSAYRTQMRLRALAKMQTQSPDDHYSFSALFSTSEAVRRKLHGEFLKFVDRAQKESLGEDANEVFQMNFDLLRWSDP